MPTLKIDVPYFVWRDGRPRWIPGPKLRGLGWKGRDLKDPKGSWLPFEQALEAARAINDQVTAAGATKPSQRKRQATARGRTVADLLDDYFESKDFLRRALNTQRDYRGKADAIRWQPLPPRRPGQVRTRAQLKAMREPEIFSTALAAAISPVEVKAFFEYLEEKRGLGMARGAIMVLSAAYTWARLSPDWRLTSNPCHRLDLPAPPVRIRIGTEEEIRALVAAADAAGSPSIGDAIYLGLFTGQRQGDILRLAEKAGSNRSLADRLADGEPIGFRQSKTGAAVKAWPTPQLVARLSAADRRRRQRKVVPQAIVVCESSGEEWGSSNFQHRFAEIRLEAVKTCPSVADFRFQDLRDTAVTWLALAEATLPEIADVTGHSLASITSILKHYLALDGRLSRQAIDKMVRYLDRQGVKL